MSVLERAKRDGAKTYLKAIGGARDIEAVTELEDNEKIVCVVTGKLVQATNEGRSTGKDTKGVLVVSDKKIIFKAKKVFGTQTIIIEGEEITSISTATGILAGGVLIKTSSGLYELTYFARAAVTDIVSALNKLKASRSRVGGGGTTIHQASSGMEEIKKAKKLLDEGIISKAEFAAIKKKHL